ncbi:MAG: dNDP-4-keto-6-deoxy-glucose-2,3- dehydratase [Lachnospiraceae bacterium]|nr:dNDP-4-keto-6-deoxy-glucose-2,3- dehydratase [Lachnospiraceae bacterium]
MLNSVLSKAENQGFSVHSTEDILDWLESRKKNLSVWLDRISLEDCKPWYYDEEMGMIRNTKGTFFQITGLRWSKNNGETVEQPIILQEEIGFLGIICCKIQGVWHYLMQAKIEPGNVNNVQVSPTIQATKSNFTQQHGGAKPAFLEYFINMEHSDVLVDQIQSEQSSRFLGKRNRNVILMQHEMLEEPPTHRWMTLPQIKELMKYDNLVNMDTRTVLSCIPYVLLGEEGDVPFQNKLYFSRTASSLDRQTIVNIYKQINDFKMFERGKIEKIPLFDLKEWKMDKDEFYHIKGYPFKLIFCNIAIEGREVTEWKQPLFAATGIATFGLLCCDDDGMLKFLIKVKPEIGCFDGIEIGPTIQEEAGSIVIEDSVTTLFREKLDKKEGVLVDVLLSEEGGRFYREQNRNVIISVQKEEIPVVPKGYVWSDYGTMNILTQINNCLNIQLRNLLSILEI